MAIAKAVEQVSYPRLTARSRESSLLIHALKQHEEGDEVGYDELAKLIGIPITSSPPSRGWQALSSARRYLESTEQVVWLPLRHERRLKRINSIERNGTVDAKLKGIRKQARATTRRLSTVVVNELDEVSKQKYLTNSAVAGALELVSQPKLRKKVEEQRAFTPLDAVRMVLSKA